MVRLKVNEREALRQWDEFRREIAEATAIDNSETHAQKNLRIDKLEANPEEWFKYYFPHYYKSDPAPFHKKATKRLLKNKRWYEVRAWSRELAKSVRSMFEILYLSLTGEIRNILLISNSSDNAERLLLPFMLELESNLRIRNDYGTQPKPGSWQIGEFTTLKGVSFRALGAGQSPRGTRNEAIRPDFILVDDIDTDEETRNPDRIKTKWEWIEQALIPTISVSGNYRILFNGNIIANDCCIARAIKKANCADIINIRDNEGKSTWPQKNSEEDIDQILSIISTASAQKEYFNNPLSEGDIFKELTWGKCPPLKYMPFVVNYSDPSTSNKDKQKSGQSFKSQFIIGYKDGKFYVYHGFLEQVKQAKFVQWYWDQEAYVNNRTQLYHVIENNSLQDPFYQQVIKPAILKKCAESGFLSVNPDPRDKPDKAIRIEGNLEPLNRNGQLILNIDEQDNPHMKRLEEQFKLFTMQLKAPADGPDCVEGGWWVVKEKIMALTTASFAVGRVKKGSKKF